MRTVKKRDGTLQEYNSSKIVNAVYLACRASDVEEISANVTANQVEEEIFHNAFHTDEVLSVEQIQDQIEQCLMTWGYIEVAKSFILYREKRAEIRKTHPDPAAISNYILYSKYSKGGMTWDDIVDKRKAMDIKKYPHLDERIEEVYEEFVRPMKVLNSMRSYQFAGEAAEVHNARMYNCSFTHIDRLEAFSELLYLLLCGCGVGFSVQKHHVERLPMIRKVNTERVSHHEIKDSIEGWADAVLHLVYCYSVGSYPEFSYSKIRHKGALLVTSGGRAPGHLPLKKAIENIRKILENAGGRRLKPIEAFSIVCYEAEAVLSGGIRRSSLICLFDYEDSEMMTAKTGDWHEKNPHYALSNNSVVLDRETTTFEQFSKIFEYVHEWGEPGFFFTNNKDYGTNPCGEIGLNPILAKGMVSGFAFCNLTEINGATVFNKREFLERVAAASFLGTLQAGYTDFSYLSDISRNIARRDSLLGIGITGFVDQSSILFRPEILREGAAVAMRVNQEVSTLIGCNPAARITCVKPSGTTSLLLGCVGSGIHPHHSRRYFRRITANPLEDAFQRFYELNPHMCQQKPNGDWVIKFPVEAPKEFEKYDMRTFMDRVFTVYESWCEPGSRTKDLTHNVSCTVVVPDGMWEECRDVVWANRTRVAAMSFLPEIGDKKYPFAPREAVTNDLELEEWMRLCNTYTPVDYSGVTRGDIGNACEGTSCEI